MHHSQAIMHVHVNAVNPKLASVVFKLMIILGKHTMRPEKEAIPYNPQILSNH